MDSDFYWKNFPRRALHFDFHTMPGIPDLGADFDGDRFGRALKSAKVEYINIFAKCNLGFAYYPSEIGTIYPGLKFDLMGEMIKSCHKYGIRAAVYLNAGLSHEQAYQHREWCVVNQEGQVYAFQKMDHWFRTMCFNSGYREYLLGMIREILEKYQIDGMIFDSMNMPPCYGNECLERMKEDGFDPGNVQDVRQFSFLSKLRFKDEIIALVRRYQPEAYLYFLGVEACFQPTHQELEVLPQGGWGYDFQPCWIRYIRTLGMPYYTMTGRFHGSWGDLGGLRPKAALLFDCFSSIMNGGTCCIGDHLHPRGAMAEPVLEMIRDVYCETSELDEWTDHAQAETEIAVLAPHLKEAIPNSDERRLSMMGMSRMLLELKQQYDVVDGDGPFERYRVLILPDFITLTSEMTAKLEKYLAGGGRIISSGWSGLTAERNTFALKSYCGALEYSGAEPCNYGFLHARSSIAENLPDMGITIYNPGIALECKDGAESLADLGRGYFNLGEWDHRHEYLYVPEEKLTGRSVIVRFADGHIVHCAFPWGLSYYTHAVPAYRTLLRNLLKQMLTEPVLEVENLPSFASATVTTQGDARSMIHLLNYVPQKRGSKEIIEEPVTSLSVKLRYRIGSRVARSVYTAPRRQPLACEVNGNYLEFCLEKLCGYQLIVVEFERNESKKGWKK